VALRGLGRQLFRFIGGLMRKNGLILSLFQSEKRNANELFAEENIAFLSQFSRSTLTHRGVFKFAVIFPL